MRREISNAELWGGIVNESGVGFIPTTQISQALKDIRRLQDIFSDEANPTCLYPVGYSDDNLAYPVECREPAERKSHSIQRAKALEEIACHDGNVSGGGPYVYQLFPTINDAVKQTSAATPDGGRPAPAQKWPWEITELPPHPVTIEEASVRHFACNDHDQATGALGRADNLVVPDLDGRTLLDDHSPPPGLEAFMECLFFLAYRTLLFRISQFRGAEKAASQVHEERSADGNRFAVKLTLGVLSDLSDKLTDLYRFKRGYDQRILGDAKAMHLVHHIASFRPIIPYACAEYTPVEVVRGNKTRNIWMSLNVLPLQGVTWLIGSHPCWRNSLNIDIRKTVARMLSTVPRQRRREDLRMMCSSTNLYASPEEYRSMPEEDKAGISTSMATTVFGDMLSQGLTILRASKGGQQVIRRVEAKVRAGL